MILIDLQKAFDTVNHDILLKKMEFIGFSEETIKWFKSYLSNRKFKVRIKNTFSEPGNLLCGVPQRSILGPVLFLLYVNDMPQAVDCELFRSSRQEVFCKKGLLRNFAKFTGKHLCQSHFFNKVAGGV